MLKGLKSRRRLLHLTIWAATLGICFPAANPAWALKDVCSLVVEGRKIHVTLTPAPGQQAVKPEDISTMRFGTYNVLNLYERVGQFLRVKPNELELIMKKGKGKATKPEWQLREIAKIIGHDIVPDIMAVQEVESERALDQFSNEWLRSYYDGVLLEGNDTRGIQVGGLVNRKYPFIIEVRSNIHHMWNDPADGNRAEPVFSRDAPVSIYRLPGHSKPVIITIVLHSKSKRDRPRDKESTMLRTAQHERVAMIVEDLQKEFGKDAPIMVMGDTNTDVVRSRELQAIRNLGFSDALNFAASDDFLPENERITHTFHPHNGPTDMKQMDAIFLSPSLQQLVSTAVIYRYKDKNGRVMPYPRTYGEREKQPSDHFPMYVDIDMRPLVQAALASGPL